MFILDFKIKLTFIKNINKKITINVILKNQILYLMLIILRR